MGWNESWLGLMCTTSFQSAPVEVLLWGRLGCVERVHVPTSLSPPCSKVG
jgi:hypothetical protein